MIPKTKAHIPPEIEQEMTIEPPGKRFFGVLVRGVALVLASHLADVPRLTKPETGQPISRVQVQIDDGRWQTARLDTTQVRRFAWRFWSLDWPDVEPANTPSPRGPLIQRATSNPPQMTR